MFYKALEWFVMGLFFGMGFVIAANVLHLIGSLISGSHTVHVLQ